MLMKFSTNIDKIYQFFLQNYFSYYDSKIWKNHRIFSASVYIKGSSSNKGKSTDKILIFYLYHHCLLRVSNKLDSRQDSSVCLLTYQFFWQIDSSDMKQNDIGAIVTSTSSDSSYFYLLAKSSIKLLPWHCWWFVNFIITINVRKYVFTRKQNKKK